MWGRIVGVCGIFHLTLPWFNPREVESPAPLHPSERHHVHDS